MADRCAIKEAQIIQGRLLDCKDEEILLGDKGIWDGANEARGSWQVEEGHSSPGVGARPGTEAWKLRMCTGRDSPAHCKVFLELRSFLNSVTEL